MTNFASFLLINDILSDFAYLNPLQKLTRFVFRADLLATSTIIVSFLLARICCGSFPSWLLPNFAVLISEIWTSDNEAVFALSEVLFEHFSDIPNLVFNEHAQDWLQFLQFSVLVTIEPGQNVYSVVELKLKILCYVINNDYFTHITPKSTEIFNVDSFFKSTAVSIETEFNQSFSVEIVQNPVGVLFEPGSENDKLVVFGHLPDKGMSMGSSSVVSLFLVKVN